MNHREYELQPDSPVVMDVELSVGTGTGVSMNGVAELKMYMVDTLLSNGSRGPVLYSAPAAWKLFQALHMVFGDAYHKMVDDPDKYAEYLEQLKDMNQ